MDRILKHVNFICLNLHGSKGIAWKEVKLTKTNFNLQKWIFVCSWWLWTNQTHFTNGNIFFEGFFIGSKWREKTSTQVQYKWPHLWVDFSFWASVVRNKIDFFFEWNRSRTLNPSQTVLHQFSFGERRILNKGKAKICWSLKMTTMLAQIPFEALRQHSAIFFLSFCCRYSRCACVADSIFGTISSWDDVLSA